MLDAGALSEVLQVSPGPDLPYSTHQDLPMLSQHRLDCVHKYLNGLLVHTRYLYNTPTCYLGSAVGSHFWSLCFVLAFGCPRSVALCALALEASRCMGLGLPGVGPFRPVGMVGAQAPLNFLVVHCGRANVFFIRTNGH